MSIETLFDHSCDIYHLESHEESPGYNLPASKTFTYSSQAHENGVPCHFTVRTVANTSIEQKEPQNEFYERTKINLPVGTDIQILDKVVDCDTGLAYTVATPPRNIRGNHIICTLVRLREQKPL